MMPKICYVDKRFRAESLRLIEKINGVIKDYDAQGYSLTLRQVYYQMVARDVIQNNEKSYKNLGNLINDARLAGMIDWHSIEDRTRNLRGLSHWDSPAEIIKSVSNSYHIDYWEEQENYVEVWVEKDALVGIVGQVCNELDVNYFSCRGYVSQSEMWAASRRLARQRDAGKNIVLLHLGDHDPSGIDMSRDIQDRNSLFGTDFEFHRLALNMNQIEAFAPPPNPTKLTDSRAGDYILNYGESCWELDALEPKVISDLISENVLKYRDPYYYEIAKSKEKSERERLEDLSLYYEDISDNWQSVLGVLD